jgi:hypothetical protein
MDCSRDGGYKAFRWTIEKLSISTEVLLWEAQCRFYEKEGNLEVDLCIFMCAVNACLLLNSSSCYLSR